MLLSQNRFDELRKSSNGTSYNYEIICRYEEYLHEKVKSNTLSLVYAKRLIDTSISFLMYCKNFKNDEPSLIPLEGYLWLHASQRYYLKYFVSFLSECFSIEIDFEKIKKPELQRPKRSHEILKKRLIRILQNPGDPFLKESDFFRVVIGYLHWIDIPQNVYINKSHVKLDKNNEHFIILSSRKIYIPNKLIRMIVV